MTGLDVDHFGCMEDVLWCSFQGIIENYGRRLWMQLQILRKAISLCARVTSSNGWEDPSSSRDNAGPGKRNDTVRERLEAPCWKGGDLGNMP